MKRKIKKKSKKTEERRCYWCRHYNTAKCPHKDIAVKDGVCEEFKFCKSILSI